jgi:hypothetical protein
MKCTPTRKGRRRENKSEPINRHDRGTDADAVGMIGAETSHT